MATIADRAGASAIRYAQCWEDADVLLEALDIRPGETCVSIASGGDNTLAMLAQNPRRVIAVDQNPAQLACLELRVAAFRALSHAELLELMGSAPSTRRHVLYDRCRRHLAPATQLFWDSRPRAISQGIGTAGKFERYLALFARWVLPLVHSRPRLARVFRASTPQERRDFYGRQWDTWRWRLLFRIFFSRAVMSRLGRDPACFHHVDGAVADHLLQRTRHALTTLDPLDNPYLQWILAGRHTAALPYALRPAHFEQIRRNLDRLEWRCGSLADVLTGGERSSVDRFNLSDVFEYMSPEEFRCALDQVLDAGRSGGRLVYWNLLVPRSRPEHLAGRLRPLGALAARLHQADRAFFYSALVIEEIVS